MSDRIDQGLEKAITYATANGCPPRIAEAIRYAIFPGGARIRRRLCLAIAGACGDANPHAANAAATAIELLHCASLVHDDMPCFDNAEIRRGKPTVHMAFGEPLALLTGDGLIVLAFETIARECVASPHLIAPLITTISKAVGMPYGLVAGQAWESEPKIDLDQYHRAKTASLFTGAVSAGAISGGGDPLQWQGLGNALGAAYQIADDLYDYAGNSETMGKPCGQDDVNNRPNSVENYGVEGSLVQLSARVEDAARSIPDCHGAAALRKLIRNEANRLVPEGLVNKSRATSAA